MDTFRFDPTQTFADVRERLGELHDPARKHLIAKVVWLDGTSAGESLSYLWDPMAERFGHTIDKEPIDHVIVDSLINGISLEVRLVEKKPAGKAGKNPDKGG